MSSSLIYRINTVPLTGLFVLTAQFTTTYDYVRLTYITSVGREVGSGQKQPRNSKNVATRLLRNARLFTGIYTGTTYHYLFSAYILFNDSSRESDCPYIPQN
jgi:hypothetical protein